MPIASDKIVFANSAIAAADSAEILFLTSDAISQSAQPLMIKTFLGATILSSFGLELLLKSIHVFQSRENTFPSGHNLEDLFNALSDQLKIRIQNDFSERAGSELEAFLTNHARSFEEWRYFAEKTEGVINFDMKSVRTLTGILKDVVNEYAS